jgi:LysM repeat protein
MNKLFLCAVALMLCALNTYAQSFKITEENIYFEDKYRTGLTGYVDAQPKQLADAWRVYVSEALNVELKKKNEKGLWTAKEVILAGITGRNADLFSLIEPAGEGSRFSTVVSFGYDTHLNSSDNPSEYYNMQKLMYDFLSNFYVEYYEAALRTKEAEFMAAESDLETAEVAASGFSDTKQITEKAVKNAQKQIDQINLKSKKEYNNIASNRKEITQVRGDIKDLYRKLPTFNTKAKFKFKQDNINYQGDVYNGFTGYINLPTSDVAAAWQDYVKTNLKVDLREKKDIYFESQEVDLPGITDKKADFKTIIQEYGHGTKISAAIAIGYEISLNSKDYPYENHNFKKFLAGFTDLYNGNNIDRIPGDKQPLYDKYIDQIIVLEQEVKASQKTLADNRKDSLFAVELIGMLQRNTENSKKLVATYTATEIAEKRANLSRLKGEMGSYRSLLEKNKYYTNNPNLNPAMLAKNVDNNPTSAQNIATTKANTTTPSKQKRSEVESMVATSSSGGATPTSTINKPKNTPKSTETATVKNTLPPTKNGPMPEPTDTNNKAAEPTKIETKKVETKTTEPTKIVETRVETTEPTKIAETQKVTTQATEVAQKSAVSTASKNNTDFKYYSVQKGDTLYSIANKFNIDVTRLKAYNNLNSERIFPGFRLSVPAN